MSVNTARTPRPNPRLARALRTREPSEHLPYPSTLLRYPNAAMFLLMREAFKIALRRLDEGKTAAQRMRFPHFAVLACLDEFGPASQREISDRLRLDQGDLVAFVDWLEEVGFVKRRRDPRDRRRYEVNVTAAGRRALHTRARAADRLNAELFAALDLDERMQLRDLLLRALERFDLVPVASGAGDPNGGLSVMRDT